MQLHSGTWLVVEHGKIELSVLSRQCLSRRISNKETLITEVAAWEKDRNNVKAQFDWQSATVDACIKLKRLYPVTIAKNST
jgi:hypothetical protein